MVVVFAAALVDLVGGVVEALPCLFVLLGGHGAYLAPLVAEFLQGFEGFDHGGLDDKLFGALAQLDFLFEVALEVEHAELFVYLYFVEELLDEEVVVLPEVVHLVARHFAYGLPFVLDGIEFVVCLFEGLLVLVDKGAELFKYLLFGFEVGGFLGVDLLLHFLSACAVDVVGGEECLGHAVVGRMVVVLVAAFGQEGFEGFLFGFLVEEVELVADGTGTVSDVCDVVVHQFVECREEVFASHGGVVYYGLVFRLCLCLVLGMSRLLLCRLRGNLGLGFVVGVVCVRVVGNSFGSFLLDNGLQFVVGDVFLVGEVCCILIQVFHFDGVLFLELVL